MKSDKWSSIFLMVFSIIIICGSYDLKVGSLDKPGSGLLPFLSGVMLLAVSFIVFVRRVGKGADHEVTKMSQLWQGLNWPKAAIVTIALLLYALVLTRLGFLLSTILLLVFLFRAIDPVKWIVSVAAASIASFCSFAVFVLWLKVQLPRGIIEKLLF